MTFKKSLKILYSKEELLKKKHSFFKFLNDQFIDEIIKVML